MQARRRHRCPLSARRRRYSEPRAERRDVPAATLPLAAHLPQRGVPVAVFRSRQFAPDYDRQICCAALRSPAAWPALHGAGCCYGLACGAFFCEALDFMRGDDDFCGSCSLKRTGAYGGAGLGAGCSGRAAPRLHAAAVARRAQTARGRSDRSGLVADFSRSTCFPGGG